MEIPADELAVEQAAAQEVKEEEVRAKVIEEFDLDETDDADKIDKLTQREIAHKADLAKAIGQKISWRTKASEAKPPEEKPPVVEPKPEPVDVKKVVAETLEERDLQSLDLPDDIKTEVKRIAQIQGVSVTQAARDPYIVAKKEAYDKVQQVEEASITRRNQGGSKKSFSADSPPDVDMSTEEGRKTWDEYKTWMRGQGN